MFRFRPPWWVREYIKKNFKIDAKDAEKRRFYLSVAYAISAFLMFNYVVIHTNSPGVVTEEEEKNLSAGEKVLLAMKPSSNARVVKYRIGEGVVSDNTYSIAQVQDTNDQSLEARKNQQLNQSQTQHNRETNEKLYE